MKLKDTAKLMESGDYKDRFKAEYYQLKIRLNGLSEMLKKYKAGTVGLSIILDTIIKKFDRRKPFEGTHRTVVCST